MIKIRAKNGQNWKQKNSRENETKVTAIDTQNKFGDSPENCAELKKPIPTIIYYFIYGTFLKWQKLRNED